jgi:outer membrane protein
MKASGLLRGSGVAPVFLPLALLLAATTWAIADESPWESPMIGAGVLFGPAYDGSADSLTSPIPMIRIAIDPLFARTTQGMLEGGVRLRVDGGVTLGLMAAYESGRPSTPFTTGHGIEPLEAGFSIGCLAEHEGYLGPAPYQLVVRVRMPVVPSRGVEADARVSAGILGLPPLEAALFLETTWANSRSARTLYGVTAEEAAASGLEEHRVGAGLLRVTAGLLWSLELPGDWCLLGSAEERFLVGNARGSPLAEEPSGLRVSLGIAYRL